MDNDNYDERFMGMAIESARIAEENGDVPIGAVIVHEDRIIAKAYNQREQLNDPTAHAEIIALSAAYSHFNDWRLENCLLISTLEPCPMCAGAAMLSRIQTIVYGAADAKFGACGSIIDIPSEKKFNHRIDVINGVRKDEVVALMKLFFQQLRDDKERVN